MSFYKNQKERLILTFMNYTILNIFTELAPRLIKSLRQNVCLSVCVLFVCAIACISCLEEGGNDLVTISS